MRSIRFTPQAKNDLVQITDYVARRNLQASQKMVDSIEQSVKRLSSVPGIGHRRTDVDDARYRFWNVKPFVIAFRYDDTFLTVIRIVHGSRDIRKIMNESES